MATLIMKRPDKVVIKTSDDCTRIWVIQGDSDKRTVFQITGEFVGMTTIPQELRDVLSTAEKTR